MVSKRRICPRCLNAWLEPNGFCSACDRQIARDPRLPAEWLDWPDEYHPDRITPAAVEANG